MPRKQERVEVYFEAKDKLSGQMNTMGKGMNRLVKQVAGVAGGFIALQAAGRALSETVGFLTSTLNKSIVALAEEEKATLRLAQAMKSGHNYQEQAYQDFLKIAEATERHTLFTADQVIAVQAMLATFKLAPDVLKTATKLTLDMATATGQDAVQAAVLMGKAAVGVTGTLSRYGIIVDQTDLKLRGFAAVVDEVNKEFGGQAQAMLNSYAGRIDQVRKAYDYLVDVFADIIIQSPQVRALFKTTSDELYRMAEVLQASAENTTVLVAVFDALATALEENKDVVTSLAVAWNILQIYLFASPAKWRQQLSQYKDLYKALSGQSEAVDRLSGFLSNFSAKMRLNEQIEIRLNEIRNAGIEDLANLEAQYQSLQNPMARFYDNTGRLAEVMQALRERIRELRGVTNEAVPVIVALNATFADTGPLLDEIGDSFDDVYGKLAEWGIQQDVLATMNEAIQGQAQETMQAWDTWFFQPIGGAIMQFGDALVDAAYGAKVDFAAIWKGMLKDFVNIFIKQMLKEFRDALAIMLAEQAALKLFGGPLAWLGLNKGGPVSGLALGGPVKRLAIGGFSTLGADSVPAMLAPGEWVVPRPAVQRYKPWLEDITREARRGYRTGGVVEPSPPSLVININAIDAEGVAESFKHGVLHDAVQESFPYLNIPQESIID